MYLKLKINLSANGLKLWIYKSNVGCCSNPARAAFCNSNNKVL